MEKQSYLSALERQFQKSEYISIAKKSYRMFTAPSRPLSDVRLFCFVLKSEVQSDGLLKKLAAYAQSVAFYDGVKKERVYVIALFEGSDLKLKPVRADGALVLPCAYDLEKEKLLLVESFPLLRRDEFKKLYNFTKNILRI
jgi:hypothetical protein